MINSNAFDYINVLDKAADAAWLRNEVISNNIANADTPGYKRQDVDFEAQLSKALGKADADNMDAKVASLRSRELEAKTHSDFSEYDYRLDENNVDIQVDGGINDKTSKLVRAAGANILVAGSFVYGAKDIKAAIDALKK